MKKCNMLVYFAAIFVFAVAQLDIAYALDITTYGNNEPAALIVSNDTTLYRGNDINITTHGDNSAGVSIRGNNSQWIFGDNTTITTNGKISSGAETYSNSRITFSDNATITTGGGFADGAAAHSDSQITFGNGATIATSGFYSVGAGSYGDSQITFGNDATIATSGFMAHGAWADYNSQITFGNNSTITTKGDLAPGADADRDSQITFGDNATITTKGNSAPGALADVNSRITFADNATITTEGDFAPGAFAADNSRITFVDNTAITTSGDESHGVAAYFTSIIEFNGDTEIKTSGSDAYALYADYSGTILSGQSGKYTISSDMYAFGGTIDLDMTVGSLFTGKTDLSINYGLDYIDENGNPSPPLDGVIRLNMADSLWDVTGNSKLTYLSLDATPVDYSSSALGTTITTETLDGPGGTFVMKTDIVGETADMLFITDTMNGSQHHITVRNNGSAETTGNEVVDLVDTADATGGFQLTNVVELGAWKYNLRQVSGGSYGSLWQLYGIGYGTTTEVVIGDPYSDYLLNYAETQTLIQRLGDLRQTPKQSGFWFKAHGGNFESSSMWMTQSFDMDYWGVQLGYDRKVEINWDGTVYAGVMFGYSKGDTNYTSGSSDIESKTVGVYGTFIHPNGFFADLVLKYRWSDSDFNSIDSAGTLVTGRDASNSGFGASLELGQRVPLRKSEEQKMGWYVEPQVQMSLQRLGGGYFGASNGLHIGAEHYTSLLGRLGMLVGYETENRNFYAKVSKVKEFRGDVTIMANSEPIDISFAGSWWVYGLGYTARLNDKNSIYVDLERSSGGLFTQKWALQAGWRMVI